MYAAIGLEITGVLVPYDGSRNKGSPFLHRGVDIRTKLGVGFHCDTGKR